MNATEATQSTLLPTREPFNRLLLHFSVNWSECPRLRRPIDACAIPASSRP
jgi:hypothetical protein